MPSRPALSVVIAAWSGTMELDRCVRSLLAQLHPGEDELVVAGNFEPADGPLPAAGPVRVVPLPVARGATVPELRARGLAAARGTVVAFLEDHCVATPAWRDGLMGGFRPGVVAVGGPVDLAPGGTALDRAVYLYDYGRFQPPRSSGPVSSLSGANMAFARAFLDDLRPVLVDDVLEVVLTEELRRRGLNGYLVSHAMVIHGSHHSAARAVPLAFHQARGYAAGRVAGAGALRRAGLALVTPLLPVVLGWRIVSGTLRRRRLTLALAASPWLAILLTAWAAGELAGYLTGAGASRAHWR